MVSVYKYNYSCSHRLYLIVYAISITFTDAHRHVTFSQLFNSSTNLEAIPYLGEARYHLSTPYLNMPMNGSHDVNK